MDPRATATTGAPDRREAGRLLLRAAHGHRRALAVGGAATLGVVAMRLALPWPLRGVIEHVFPAGSRGLVAPGVGFGIHPVLWFCWLYLVLSVASGAFEWAQRVWMARAAGGLTHDLRSAAVRGLARRARHDASAAVEGLTRIIGDSAGLKADLKGILIHLGQNGLLLLAITGLFLVLAPTLGLLFLLAGLLAIAIGHGSVSEVAETTERQRRKEARYAATIREGDEDDDDVEAGEIDASSTRKDVQTTKIIARTTLFVHAAVGATIAVALWLGVREVRAGTLLPGELFLFIAYAITIQRRAVMIGRQIARGGKLLTNAGRLGEMIAAASAPVPAPRRLVSALRLQGVKVKRLPTRSAGRRLGPLDLTLPAGTRLLVLGGPGAGKSTLLALCAGQVPARAGRILWDDADVTPTPERLRASCAHLPEEPVFGRASLRTLLGLPAGEPTRASAALLEQTGAARVVRTTRQGLDQRLPSSHLAPLERRAVALASVLLDPRKVWLLDTPVDGRRGRHRAQLAAVLDGAGKRTVVVALRRPLLVERFDRVLVLRRGKVAFSGTPEEWRTWNEERRRAKAARRAPPEEPS
jgi:ABC-type multidrug transport system fused ATPase/permease subunit